MEQRPDRPLKVVFYSPALPESGASNGIVTYTRVMRDALRALGHKVLVVTTEYIEKSDGSVSNLPTLPSLQRRIHLWREARRPRDGSDPWVRFHVRQALAAGLKHRPDVMEMEESYGWGGMLAASGTAIVERMHGPHAFVRDKLETVEEQALGDLREEAEGSSLTKVQAVSFPSHGLLRAIRARYQLELPLARVIPNPMPVVARNDAWDVSQVDPNRILFVGRFDLCKGADILLQAFAKAWSERNSLSLIFAGPDTGLKQHDGTRVHFEEFVRQVLPHKVCSRIEFLGKQSHNQIYSLRRKSGLAVVPSRFESFSYTVAEAMSIGMPVLTSASFGGCELVRDRLDGRIVPVEDVRAMADALVQMTADPQGLAAMGRSAYRRASELLAPEWIAKETIALYNQARSRLADT